MAFEQEQRAALRILEGIEEGTASATDATSLVEDADPALVYLIFTGSANATRIIRTRMR